jgi:hypothetical protein
MSAQQYPAGEVCIANISPAERKQRLAFGVAQFIVALLALAVLVIMGVERWWRLGLVVFFWGAASGFFQWRDKT